MVEEWKVCNDCRAYEVSTLGNVRRADTKEAVIGSVTKRGYVRYDLSARGKRIVKFGHRLVALAFISNPLAKPEVNHKNGNKADNNVNNLEWCTGKENVNHSFKVLGRTPPNKKRVLCIESGVVYDSCTAAADGDYSKGGKISQCCNGKRLTAYGFHWQYI